MRAILDAPANPWLRRAQMYALLMAAFTALPALARVHVLFEITSHFRLQFALTLALVAALLAALRLPRTALLVALTALLNALHLLPALKPHAQPPAGGAELKVVTYNVLSSNDSPDALAALKAFVAAERPDVLLVVELTARHAQAVADPDLGLVGAAVETRTDNFGIGLYTRLPARDARILHFDARGVPAVAARLDLPGTTLTLVGVHPVPPVAPASLARRTRQLEGAASLARAAAAEGPVVLLGDLNVTPYSPFYDDLLQQSGLRDSAHGFGVHGTWPNGNPILRVPIDHVLVSPGVAVLERRVEAPTESDHRAVVVRLALPGP